MRIWLDRFTHAFPLWVLGGGLLALVEPGLFLWMTSKHVVLALAVVMLGMGFTLSWDDFRGIARMPAAVGTGFAAQYVIMPLMGWASALLFNLPPQIAAGLILVGCCPGGTASNVVTYLARGNVALSVVMTACSTFAAVFMTPLLTQWLAGKYVDVNPWGLFLNTLQVVVAPVLAGAVLTRLAPRMVARAMPACPPIAVIAIVLICSSIVARNATQIQESGLRILGAVVALHTGGFALGYLLARVLRFEEPVARTISIEVGMQNSGLGVVLAQAHFTDKATGVCLAAVPCAISSIVHSVIGSLLAGLWRLNSHRQKTPAAQAPTSASR
ncbi:MAG: bile acid:sodium symporter family protein [Verrucomicrobia bacterium]|nr:bile acid:sodium symporter family protein [Verrucomicrobiota bacterium]